MHGIRNRARGGGRVRLVLGLLLATLVVSTMTLVLAGCSSSTEEAAAPEVTDMLGRSLAVSVKPERIVTTHPTATEMLYVAGGVAVARDSSSKYPAEVTGLPTVGSAYSISAEAVAAQDPDLIIVEALTQASLVDQFSQLGLPVLAVRASTLDDIKQSISLVGEVLGNSDAADQAIAGIESRIDAARDRASGEKSVLILIADAQNNIYAAKPASYPGAVAALIGLNNLAETLPDAGGLYAGYAPFTAEQAAGANPDMVFAITPAPAPAPRLSTLLSRMPGFKDMPAVAAGRMVELDASLFLQAQGPRIADAVENMLDTVNNS